MATKLINKLTRELTDQEAHYILTKIWQFSLHLWLNDAEGAEERREIKAEQYGKVREVVGNMFKPASEADSSWRWFIEEYTAEEEPMGLNTAIQTVNYLHKIGALI